MRRAFAPPVLDEDVEEYTCSSHSPTVQMGSATEVVSGLYVGTMVDAADVFWSGNNMGFEAVVNCAQRDFLRQIRKGRLGSDFADRLPELSGQMDALPEVPGGGAVRGTVMGVAYMGFDASDVRDFSLRPHLPPALAFVREQLQGGRKVLVHCLRGENRSAAVCAAILIKQGSSAEDAVDLLREKRGDFALSNEGFVDQLRALQTEPG